MGELGSIVDEVEGAQPEAAPEVPPATFADFYADHFGDLVRLATLMSGSADVAPDLVQDCFVRLHARWTSVRDPLPYVRRSVVHACASHHRRNAVVRRNPLPSPRPSELGADELDDALAALPARQRAAVVLRYYADLPDAEIARALRCREGTVRSLISRALADLRKVIHP
jgi:RNA polymerase sigma-70 factor (sigma-E family)